MRFSSIVLLAFAATALAGDTDRKKEYGVKAGMLRLFAGYTTWPAKSFARSDSPLVIGVIGKDPFGRILDALGRKRIGRRGIVIRRLKKPAETVSCHVVFVGRQGTKERAATMAAMSGRPVLSVGEDPDFTRSGGIIGYFIRNGRVRYEVNVDEARRAGLKLHAKLLRSARIVRDGKKAPKTKPGKPGSKPKEPGKKPGNKKKDAPRSVRAGAEEAS